MKKLYKNKRGASTAAILLTCAFLIGVVINSCKKPNDNIAFLVNTSTLSKSPVLLHFANANNASTNQPADFKVKISGKDTALVQMDGGSTNFQASHGFVPLSLMSAAAPSASNPVSFNVYAEIPGFAPVTESITITSDTAQVIDLTAIEYAHPAPGTAVATSTTSLTSGVSAGTSINVAPSSGMQESANVSIPSGTQMLDVNGNAIAASTLTANVVDYSAVSKTSYSAFPGGYSPTNVVDANGNQVNSGQPLNFVSAGLLSVNMTADNTPVKHFSKPVQVTMELDPNTTNFKTGANIVAGDIIPVWSLNEETGQWKTEGNATVITAADGKPAVTFSTTHLSCFNLDWTWAISPAILNTCYVPLKVTLHVGAGNSGVYDVALVTPSNQYLAAAHWENVYDGDVVTFPYVAGTPNAKIVISNFNLYLNPGLPILAQTPVFNPCTQGSIDLTFGSPPTPDYVNVSADLVGHCTNKNLTAYPTGWFFMYDYTAALAGKSAYVYLYLSNGSIVYSYGTTLNVIGNTGKYSIKLINGDRYYVYAFNNSTWYASGLFTMKKSNFNLPTVSSLIGNAIYDAPSNTINIKGSFKINCN